MIYLGLDAGVNNINKSAGLSYRKQQLNHSRKFCANSCKSQTTQAESELAVRANHLISQKVVGPLLISLSEGCIPADKHISVFTPRGDCWGEKLQIETPLREAHIREHKRPDNEAALPLLF